MTSPLPEPDEHTCWIFLVRHGATANNLADPPILQGQGVDLELSSEGRRQAQATAVFLSSFEFAAAYSSPLRRARETAEILAGPHELEPIVVEDLTEADVGAWERRSWVEIAKTEPEAFRAFRENPAEVPYSGGENLTQVRQRVEREMRRLGSSHLGERIVVAAHNVVNRSWMASLLELPMGKVRRIPQDNCGVNIIRFRKDDFKVVAINSVFHLSHKTGEVSPTGPRS